MRDRAHRPTRLGRGALLGASAACALVLAAAEPALANTWFAEPGGNGPEPCLMANPCGIDDAVDGAPPGAKVAALAGVYEVGTGGLDVDGGVRLQGPWSGPAAVVSGDGLGPAALTATGTGTRVSDLTIEQSDYGAGIEVGNGALADRIIARTSGSGAACVPRIDGLMRDSVCHASGSGNGVLVDEDTAVSGSAEIVNVTAIGEGDGALSAAMLVRASGGADIEVLATNVIADSLGPAPDIAAGALIGTSSLDVALAGSNYGPPAIVGGFAAVTPEGTNGNQTQEPSFSNPGSGDFSEEADSPTVDAGTSSVASIGLLDVLRVSRSSGDGPDIGAYEYVEPPDTRAPNVSIVSAPKGTLKTRNRFVDATFELASDEEDATFECRIDRLPIEPCTSPVTYRLKATKGVGTTYVLTVRATDAAGNRSGKAIRQVTVIRKKG